MRILCLLILIATSCKKEVDLKSIIKQSTPYIYECTSISFVDSLHGYATGGDTWTFGYILRTLDGGTTWSTDTTTNFKIEDFYYDTTNHKGFTCGYGGQVYEQLTDQNKWSLYREDFIAYRSCWFRGDSLGVLLQGGGWIEGEIRRYHPFYWQLDTIYQTTNHLNDIWFVNKDTAVAVGIGYILYSDDAASTWQQLPYTGEYYVSVHFPTPLIGYIATETGNVLRTEDGGKTWSPRGSIHQPLLTYHNVHEIFFVSQDKGYIVGDGGIFSKTTDGGNNWSQIADAPSLDYTSIYARGTQGWIGTKTGEIFYFVE